MDYADWLWIKLGLVALAAFLYRFILGLIGPAPSDTRDEPPRG